MHRMCVIGVDADGDPIVVHNDEAMAKSFEDARDIRTEQDKCMNNKNPDEFTDEEYIEEWKDRGDERKHPDQN